MKQSAWLFAAAHIDTLLASIAVTYGTFETQDFQGHSANLAAHGQGRAGTYSG